MTVTVTPSDSRTTPLGVWRYGYDYLKAARRLDDADPNPWVSSNVTHQCVCQAVELAFKSFLLAHGKTLNDLRDIGHSMLRAMQEAEQLGLTPRPAGQRAAITQMDGYYRQHEFRYIVTGIKDYPPLDALLTACAWVLHEAAPDVAASMGNHDLVNRMRLDVSSTFGKTPPA